MKLAANIAAAMTFLHAKEQLHHDLKSANVLVFDSVGGLQAKLTDFGLAHDPNSTLAATTMNAAAGTCAYMAPEQFGSDEDGARITKASEVYSFAIVLWELLHGGRPWDGLPPYRIMANVSREVRPTVSEALPDGVLRQVMVACWAADADARPTFAAVEAKLTAAQRTFESSNFKRLYAATDEVTMYWRFMQALHGLVSREARRLGVPQARADEALLQVQSNAFHVGWQEAIDPAQLRNLVARVWSSAAMFEGRHHWPCSLLQAAIRDDDHVEDAVVFARALNAFVVRRVQLHGTRLVLPRQVSLPRRTYRGGSLPRNMHHFFSLRKKFRMPMFLSSTTDRHKAKEFMQEQTPDGSFTSKPDAVKWTFRFDPENGCNHVSPIDRHDGSLVGDPNRPAEAEWLFAPYSVFTVRRVVFKDNPTWTNPYEIELDVAPDNQLEPTDLPLAPWG